MTDKQQPVDLDSFEGHFRAPWKIVVRNAPRNAGREVTYIISNYHVPPDYIHISDEVTANARLIAAAPSMAAELRQLWAENESLRNPWVPIDEIPEEWKDGRPVDFVSNKGGRATNYRYRSRWMDWYHAGKGETKLTAITHAMLPPNPPKHTGELA